VTEYIKLDAPDNAPIEAYPPGETDDPNIAAVISYINVNYSEGRHYIVPRLDRLERSQVICLATEPGKLEKVIQPMELRKYFPEPKTVSRCNGRYTVSMKDPALLLPDGMDFTMLIQFHLCKETEYQNLNREVSTFCGIFSPEHRLEITSVVRVMPNLTEQAILEGQDAEVIRIRFSSSFCFNTFLGLSANESTVKQEWKNIADKYLESSRVIAHRPVNLLPVAIFPMVTPEHGIEAIKEN
jgi:hypothetical protein